MSCPTAIVFIPHSGANGRMLHERALDDDLGTSNEHPSDVYKVCRLDINATNFEDRFAKHFHLDRNIISGLQTSHSYGVGHLKAQNVNGCKISGGPSQNTRFFRLLSLLQYRGSSCRE